MNPQLQGVEELAGTYTFDLRTSHRTFGLNRFFWRLTDPAWREQVVADEEAAMREAGLSAQEQQLVRARDWIGLIRYGTILFVLEKFARVVKQSNLEVFAAMRGEALDEFLQTRRAPECR